MKHHSLVLLLSLLPALPAFAQPTQSQLLAGIGFVQRMNQLVPQQLAFRDETGKAVRLGDYFGRQPVIMALAYAGCPNLCTLELKGLVEGLRGIPATAGQQFQVVVVSIDPDETPALAARRRAAYLHRYDRPGAAAGWHWLTGREPQIRQLAAAVGFRYAYDAAQGQYAHPSGLMVLTPGGRLARYFYGVDYAAADLQRGLMEASAGTIGSPIDRLVLRCYHYDPVAGRYELAVMRLVQAGGSATALALLALILALSRGRRP